MKNPLFSVIIPARNEEEVIERSINSVLDQTFQDFEVIISNDGSTDKTQEIVEGMIKKDKRIKILNRPQGHSAAFARNRGAEAAKGEILVFLDADTLINEIFLEEISKKNGKADAFIVICLPLRENFVSLALSGMIGKPFKLKLQDGTFYNKKNKEEAGAMFFTITKKAYQKIGGYDEKTFYYEDELFSDKFYDAGFKSILVKKAIQKFELPSSFNEFLRQCKWMGKGTNTIIDKGKRIKHKTIWFGKTLFLLSPLFFLAEPKWALGVFITTFLLTYLVTLYRNKKPLLSILTTPFVYMKTFLVTFNIIKFWK
jgi:glycosyltransferase involved in cell wall biosynthesis